MAVGIFRLRIELRALRSALEELRYAVKEHSETVHSAEEARSKDYAIPKRLPVLVSYDEQANKGQGREYGIQDKIAKWTKRAVIAASIYAAIAFLQWYATREANHIARDAINAQTRPWIGMTEVKLGATQIVRPDSSLILHVSYKLRNYGHSPATRTSVEGVMRTGFHFLRDWRNFVPCEDADKDVWDVDRPANVIFQGEDIDKEDDFESPPENGLNGIHVLIVCIAYRDPSLKVLHHTKIAFTEINLGTIVPQIGDNDIPSARLRLLDMETDD